MKQMWILFLFLTGMAHAAYTNESEVSLINSKGNSEFQTSNIKTTNLFKWNVNSLMIGGHYTYSESDVEVTARNWDITTIFEHQISQILSLVLGEVIEGNKFINIKSRYNTDLGLRYFYKNTEKLRFFSEAGYRYTIEDRYDPYDNAFDNKAKIYNELVYKSLSKSLYRVWLEYIPNFSYGSDYLINGEVSITSILNSTFSLRLAYKGMYDNRPISKEIKNYDSLTTVSVVAKF